MPNSRWIVLVACRIRGKSDTADRAEAADRDVETEAGSGVHESPTQGGCLHIHLVDRGAGQVGKSGQPCRTTEHVAVE